MLSLLAVALLAQAPADARPVAVLATSKRPGVDQYVATLTTRAHALLQREGVGPLLDEAAGRAQLKLAGLSDSRTCQGGRACVTRLAVILGARAVVVGIDVGKAGASLAVVMEAIAADSGQPLVTSEFSVPIASFSDDSALPVTLFARQLKAKLDADRPKPPPPEAVVVVAPRPQPPPDAPMVPRLDPPPPTPPPQVIVSEPGGLSAKRAVGWISGGGAALAGGAGVVLALMGNGAKGQLAASIIPGSVPPASTLPESQLRNLQGQANGAFTGALISAIAAGALAAVSVYCFATDG